MKIKFNLFTTLLVLLNVLCASGQVPNPIAGAVYLDKYQAEITDLNKAHSYQVIMRDSVNNNVAVARTYFMSGKLKSEVLLTNEALLQDQQWKTNVSQRMFIDADNKTSWVLDGQYKEWYESGKIRKVIDYKNGYLVKRLLVFWENGELKRNEMYNANGKFIMGQCYDKSGDPCIFTPFNTNAYWRNFTSYYSPEQLIKKNTHYPQAAIPYKDAGIVLIYHYIDGRGKNFKNIIQYGLNPILNEEALRVVQKMSGMYNPATEDDEPTSFVQTISVRFNLPKFTIDLLKNAGPKDTVYFNLDGYVTKLRSQAETMELYVPVPNDSSRVIRTIFNKQGIKTTEITINKKQTIQNLEISYPNPDANTSNSNHSDIYRSQLFDGPYVTYYDNGNIKEKTTFENGRKVKPTELFYADGSVAANSVNRLKTKNDSLNVYDVVEHMPEFPGGDTELLSFIGRNLRLPPVAMEQKVSGTVIVRFAVFFDGQVGNVSVIKSLTEETDAEAIRVISMLPQFYPGMHNGMNVAVWYTLPIAFRSM